MNCIEVAATLNLFIDGELCFEESEAIRSHLNGCPPCDAKRQAEEIFKLTLRSKLPRRECTDCIRDDVR